MTTPPPPSSAPGAGPEPGEVPVCPRHTDRVSYVRCQRCGRPACPECQVQAAVGVHCVDCVREASRNAPQARTVFGATLRDGRPVVTLTLIGLSVLSFVLQQTLGRAWTDALIFAPFLGETEPWRFLTAAFLHSPGFLHIGFNMFALWIIGPSLEQALGRWRFISLYVLAAIGGSLMVTLLASPATVEWGRGLVGASGAVFGLFGAILIVLRRLGRDARQIVVILGINAVLGFVVPGISWQAHLGGFLVGLVLGVAYAYAPRPRRGQVAVAATVGVAVLLVVLAALKYASVAAWWAAVG
ncbi:rhomboid family intramembrane serine protease [Actinotalea sp. BY-33]|uniref:Rhomboid family intramembrane serine protease n=1 Tax=Actinotalea soli TaxID=2819234 RepID=A0A939LMX3_9CELL|nr:rhomboid family intramembrane serine protease [Actinotalea soli]MBO1751197.1 rhomboid family intramembrane serine protease [Actinotalea soli]